MIREEFIFNGGEDTEIYYYRWKPVEEDEVKGVILLLHGMAEHALRYDKFAKIMTDNGYIMYANDHRGHGKTGLKMGKLGYFGYGGWDLLVDDVYELVNIIKTNHKGLPLILFGHSMGSLIARTCISEYGFEFDGIILSGTSNGVSPLIRKLGLYLARLVSSAGSGEKKSPFLHKIIFGNYNDKFSDDTPYEWLTRDKGEIEKYMVDELCGFICTSSLYVDMLDGINRNAQESNVRMVPGDLPMYIYSGSMDPVGNFKKDVQETYSLYKDVGKLKDVKLRFYDEARHEMHNEINRDEMYDDLIGWLQYLEGQKKHVDSHL